MQITAITTLLLSATVESLIPLKHKRPPNHDEIDKILDFLNSLSTRRAVDPKKLSMARQIYKRLKKSHLRQESSPPDEYIEQAKQAETELKSTLVQTKPAILERPFIEESGKNDFLVMGLDDADKHVTIIPNHIYYNVEKKCVNWMDDCSLKGIRQRLLRGVQWP